jgi:hypothetical protein
VAAAPVTCLVDQLTGAVNISVNPVGRAPGIHNFLANVTAQYGSNTPQQVTITLTVTP